jgi:fibronectin-binding autotransporter adhesin
LRRSLFYFCLERTAGKLNATVLACICSGMLLLYPPPILAQRTMEVLDRGLLAVKVNEGVYISWRLLGTEWQDAAFNLYRGTDKINAAPLSGGTNFLDPSGTLSSEYHVRAVIDGTEQEPSDTVPVWPESYRDIPVRDIPGGYTLNDASVGDLDGDGEYEIVVKRISPDLTAGAVYFHLLEAYRMDGTHLWTINYGPNRLGPQQVNFIVYDLDCDGRAEVITKTSEGTIDGTGVEIGDTDGDGITNYRSTALGDDIIGGPEFLSVYEGATGREVFRRDYISRDPLTQWGLPGHSLTQLAHRADAVMMAVIYANGKTPTLVMCRGIYHRTKMVAMDYAGGALTELWSFDSAEYPESYDGQGNHNLSVADVDNDGKDEIIYGSMVVDHDGTGLNTTGMGHGDAMHVSDMDPERPGLEVWQAMEQSPYWGGTYRDAATAEVLIQYIGNRDMGRACAGDITAAYPGYELWGATECPLYSCNGEEILPGPNGLPVNFMIWWDGDLLREFLDHQWLGSDAGVGIGTISKFNGTGADILLTANGTWSTNGTKGNPCLSADILGDWREEVIWRTTDDRYLRIYTTTQPTTHRIYTLMHDPQYRLAIAWQPNAYNQPPHPGFFIGNGMDGIPPPPLAQGKLIWNSGGTWDPGISEHWLDRGDPAVFSNGDDVLFGDMGNPETVTITGSLEPGSVTVLSAADYTFTGQGTVSGSGTLVKSGSGTLAIENANDYTGLTSVWNGAMVVSGSLLYSHVAVKRFCTVAGSGSLGNGLTLEPGSRILPGMAGQPDTLEVSGGLEARDAAFCFDLSCDSTGTSSPNDMIIVDGDLSLEGTNDFLIKPAGDTIQHGTYTLIQYTGVFTGDAAHIRISGLPGTPTEVTCSDHRLRVRFLETRPPARLLWKGGSPDDWDLVTSLNWERNGNPDWFVPHDTVVFTDAASGHNEISLAGVLVPGLTLVDAGADYTFMGEGSISGPGGLVKSGSGKLAIRTVNDYTGPTVVNGGTLEIPGLTNAGYPGALGAADASPGNLVLGGGTLLLTGSSSSDRSVLLQGQGGTVKIPAGAELRMNGSFSGTGSLVKSGAGKLVLNAASTHSGGIVLREGTIYLGTEEACISGPGAGPVTMEQGTLQMLDNAHSYTNGCRWDLVVPSRGTARLFLDSRCQLTGSLSGEGTLNLYTPFVRSELLGDWSAFRGTINVSTDNDGGTFIAGNRAGYPLASIHLGDHVTALYGPSEDVTIEIGELTGTALSRLGAGGQGSNSVTWKIGSAGTRATFHGVICDDQMKNEGASASVIKTGPGTWTLTNASTYSGQTVIAEGALRVSNTTGSGTGPGPVTVLGGGTLEGDGTVAGPVFVEEEGVLRPGVEGAGNIHVNSDVQLNESAFLVYSVDPATLTTARLVTGGTCTMNGYIYFTGAGEISLEAGNSFDLVDAAMIRGTLSGILPAAPGSGLEWDTVYWRDYGVISVNEATKVTETLAGGVIRVFPNPAKDILHLELAGGGSMTGVEVRNIGGQTVRVEVRNIGGQTARVEGDQHGMSAELKVAGLEPGVYFVIAITGRSIYIQKFIKE